MPVALWKSQVTPNASSNTILCVCVRVCEGLAHTQSPRPHLPGHRTQSLGPTTVVMMMMKRNTVDSWPTKTSEATSTHRNTKTLSCKLGPISLLHPGSFQAGIVPVHSCSVFVQSCSIAPPIDSRQVLLVAFPHWAKSNVSSLLTFILRPF